MAPEMETIPPYMLCFYRFLKGISGLFFKAMKEMSWRFVWKVVFEGKQDLVLF